MCEISNWHEGQSPAMEVVPQPSVAASLHRREKHPAGEEKANRKALLAVKGSVSVDEGGTNERSNTIMGASAMAR